MAKCELAWAPVKDPHLAIQPDYLPSAPWCATHQMAPTDSSGMCPIGRIEDATEKALAQIAAARDK